MIRPIKVSCDSEGIQVPRSWLPIFCSIWLVLIVTGLSSPHQACQRNNVFVQLKRFFKRTACEAAPMYFDDRLRNESLQTVISSVTKHLLFRRIKHTTELPGSRTSQRDWKSRTEDERVITYLSPTKKYCQHINDLRFLYSLVMVCVFGLLYCWKIWFES